MNGLMFMAVVLAVSATCLADVVDHGVPAPVSECRGAIAALDSDGKPIVLALAADLYDGVYRTSLLVVDATTGEATQYWHPKREAGNAASYSLMLSKANRLYVTFGSTFLEFDIASRQWTGVATAPGAGTAMSFDEGPDGMIYASLYPTSELVRFDPKTKQLEALVDLDPTQKYPSYTRVGDDGWVYVGIGTAKNNLVAYNPETGELRQLADEAQRGVGTSSVRRGDDGQIYGKASANEPWLRLEGGKGTPVESVPPIAPVRSTSWQRNIPDFGNGWTLAKFDLPGRRMTVNDGDTKREVTFDYESQGALLTTLVAGPNNTVHGSTAHPMHWFTVRDGKINDLGHVEPIGGGNICGFANVGDTMYGAAYGGGVLYALDPSKPFNGATGDEPNPKQLLKFPAAIGRPRALLRFGDFVIMAGYPGYGRAGGGLGFYNTTTGEHQLLEHDDVIPGHATITLRALDDNTLVGGTSIHTPGGADAVAKEAMLYLFDTKSMKVVFSTVPVPEHASIAAVEVDNGGRVFGVTQEGTLFIFDPQSREVVARFDLAEHGAPVRPDQSLLRDEAGRIYVLLNNAVMVVEPGSSEPVLLATLPVRASAGSALVDGRIYFGSGAHVYSVPVTQTEAP